MAPSPIQDTVLAEVVPGVVHAAGALVWRERDSRLEVAVVHRPAYNDWSWPKGKLEVGESAPAAAVREVEEEIGSPVVLGVPLPGLRYGTPDGRGKHVRYWAAREATEEDAPALAARGRVERAAATEIDDVVWVSTSTAAQLLTRATDRAPLDVLEDLWNRERLATHVLAVARHGRARRRSAHRGDEESRPLTAEGAQQAQALVPVLAAFGIAQVVTSPWLRCVETVRPYAERTSVPVLRADALTERAASADPSTVRDLVADHLERPRDAVVSTHRPVLPLVIRTISGGCRRWTLGQLPASDPYLRPGEVLVTHVMQSGTKVVAVETHRPRRDKDAKP
jgi:8-oxo-dGTP pyrophosphatase MutT (NUDIX family)/phosphohistidine phosphatase SixA